MNGFDYRELLLKFRYPLLIFLVGTVLILGGIFFLTSGLNTGGTKVEILTGGVEQSDNPKSITAEISGEVIHPGVYKISQGSRVEDLLISSGGFSAKADREWTDKYLNRAAKITDGQKVYIPAVGQQSNSSSAKTEGGDQTTSAAFSSDSKEVININSASLGELDALPGIGQVYGQNIIEHRPYSVTTELVSKGAIKQNLYDKIKNLISVY